MFGCLGHVRVESDGLGEDSVGRRAGRYCAQVLDVTLRHLGRHIKVNEEWKDSLMCPVCTAVL